MDVSQSGLCSGYQSSISMWLTGGQFPEDKHSVPEASMSLKHDEDGIDTEKKKKASPDPYFFESILGRRTQGLS